MDPLLRSWLDKNDKRADAHDLSDETKFTEIFNRLSVIEKQMARLLIVVGIANAIAGAVLTIVGMVVAKKLGF